MKYFVSLFENKKNSFIFGAIVLLFILLRLPGLTLEYHQDEWKNVHASEKAIDAGNFFAHPPLMQIFFRAGYSLFGTEHFRIFPFLFSLLSIPFLFVVIKKRAGERKGLWGIFLFSLCFYSVLGSLMTDVDGSVLPLFFLLSVFAYDRWGESSGSSKRKWFALLFLFAMIGFLVKLSFILVVAALFVDYVWKSIRPSDIKKLTEAGLFGILFLIVYIVTLFIFEFLYPSFSIDFMLSHAQYYDADGGRNSIQIIVQAIKAIFYLSPLLFAPLFFLSRPIFEKTRVFFIYLATSFLFYFVLFDFSGGALDKYLMVMIVPLSIICGCVLGDMFERGYSLNRKDMTMGIGLSSLLLCLNFFPHTIIGLYPKTEWFRSVLHLKWNILNPFNGGSGPLGFYVSFLFIAASFFMTIVVVCIGIKKKSIKSGMIALSLFVGISYNLFFTEELVFGKINGSSYSLLDQSVEFLVVSKNTSKVLTYNDIGAHQLEKVDLYAGRFYAAPQFEEGHKKKFADFTGRYLVVDVPHISLESFYGKFFLKCKSIFEAHSGKMKANVYDCENSANIVKTISNE